MYYHHCIIWSGRNRPTSVIHAHDSWQQVPYTRPMRKAKHRFCSRILSIERSVTSHLPNAVLPSTCLTPRRQPRPIHHAHPAIRSTNCALTETHSNNSLIAPTQPSPTGTVCFCACNVLTDMLSTDVSRHAPAQDTAAHCIPTTVAHELRLWLRVVRMHHG